MTTLEQSPQQRCNPSHCDGDPATRILLVVEELEAGMIVLGAHHPRKVGAPSHVPWAIAARVIAGARCPVLTVRDPN